MSKPRALEGLSAVAAEYPLILSDVWGVLHNGEWAFREAVDALTSYRGAGGRVALVTNAPRPAGPIVEMLDRLGVGREAYDVIVSSGDVTRGLIAGHAGGTVHHVGPDIDLPLFEGIDVARGGADEASAIIVTDLDDDERETPDSYRERMAHWLERGLPLICANPDKYVERGTTLFYCGGALADLYAEMGGEVVMAGKPFAPIYEEAIRLLGEKGAPEVPRNRILAIGDAVRTDARGAADQGLDFLFITDSVHAADMREMPGSPEDRVDQLIAPSGVNLVGFMSALAW